MVGKYLVFLPFDKYITISLKLENSDERSRLAKIVKEILPKETGAIIRTEAKWKNQIELQEDMQNILIKWREIRNRIKENEGVLSVIYENKELLDKIITNITPSNITKVITDDKEMYKKYNSLVDVVYQDEFGLSSNLKKQLTNAKNRRVWLNSGAYITIDKTEALTAIDVNSAKYVGKKNAEETFFHVNKEATIEIAKQIRLRNISGMILIDYINMQVAEHKTCIIDLLRAELKKDRSKFEVLGFTKLNLLEMIRQHQNG